MKRTCCVAVAVCLIGLLVAAATHAQAPAAPKPGPEVQKLKYFVGEWKYEGESKESPFGPAGKFTATETCEWFAGGFQVICRGVTTGPAGGKITGMSVIGYDPETKEYTYYGIDSTGFNFLARGTASGDTWTYNWAGTIGGKPAKVRATLRTSPGFHDDSAEGSVGGGPMSVFSSSKATRVK